MLLTPPPSFAYVNWGLHPPIFLLSSLLSHLLPNNISFIMNMNNLDSAGRKSRSSKKPKKSGVRTKFLIESLRNEFKELREENEKLRGLVTSNLPDAAAQQILSQCYDHSNAPKASIDNIDDLPVKITRSNRKDKDGYDYFGCIPKIRIFNTDDLSAKMARSNFKDKHDYDFFGRCICS